MASASILVPIKNRDASSGVQTVGWARTLKLVLTMTGGQLFEAREQRVIARISLAMRDLDASGVVDMHNG